MITGWVEFVRNPESNPEGTIPTCSNFGWIPGIVQVSENKLNSDTLCPAGRFRNLLLTFHGPGVDPDALPCRSTIDIPMHKYVFLV